MSKKQQTPGQPQGHEKWKAIWAAMKLLPRSILFAMGVLIGMGLLGGGSQAVDLARGIVGLPRAPAVASSPSGCDAITKDIRRLAAGLNRLDRRLARVEGALGVPVESMQ